MKLKLMVMGLAGVVGLMIIFGVITGMLRISILDNPEETEHTNILSKLAETGNLELVHYNFDETSAGIGNNTGGDSLKTGGEAAACINLKEVTSDDIKVERNKVIISLPSPELCYANVTGEKPEVSQAGMSLDEVPSGSGGQDVEKRLLDKAVSLGIYDQAEQNAEKLVHALLSSVTDKQIILHFRE